MLTWAVVSMAKYGAIRGGVREDLGCVLITAMVCDVAIFYFLFEFQPWK